MGKGSVKTLWLTEKGKKALGIDAGESDRYGGPEHRYWVKRIADHLRANGYEVTEEFAQLHLQIGIKSLHELINKGMSVKHLRF